MSAYIIAEIDVHDSTQYEEYKKLASVAIREHGAEPCVRGGEILPLEGSWKPSRLVVMKFADVALAQAFYDSESYKVARVARVNAANVRMIVAQGT